MVSRGDYLFDTVYQNSILFAHGGAAWGGAEVLGKRPRKRRPYAAGDPMRDRRLISLEARCTAPARPTAASRQRRQALAGLLHPLDQGRRAMRREEPCTTPILLKSTKKRSASPPAPKAASAFTPRFTPSTGSTEGSFRASKKRRARPAPPPAARRGAKVSLGAGPRSPDPWRREIVKPNVGSRSAGR